MKQKNDVENIRQDLENNNDNIQIEYNDDDDFELEKTKSLNKFPLKAINNEFYLDDIYKIIIYSIFIIIIYDINFIILIFKIGRKTFIV